MSPWMLACMMMFLPEGLRSCRYRGFQIVLFLTPYCSLLCLTCYIGIIFQTSGHVSGVHRLRKGLGQNEKEAARSHSQRGKYGQSKSRWAEHLTLLWDTKV